MNEKTHTNFIGKKNKSWWSIIEPAPFDGSHGRTTSPILMHFDVQKKERVYLALSLKGLAKDVLRIVSTET